MPFNHLACGGQITPRCLAHSYIEAPARSSGLFVLEFPGVFGRGALPCLYSATAFLYASPVSRSTALSKVVRPSFRISPIAGKEGVGRLRPRASHSISSL